MIPLVNRLCIYSIKTDVVSLRQKFETKSKKSIQIPISINKKHSNILIKECVSSIISAFSLSKSISQFQNALQFDAKKLLKLIELFENYNISILFT